MRAAEKTKSLLDRVGLVLIFLTLGVLLAGIGAGGAAHFADGLKYSTRLSGTPGLLEISECVTSDTGKQRHTDCFGDFRSDDHRVKGRYVSISRSYKKGTVLPVQWDERYHCYTVGVAPTAGRLAAICACALAVMAGLALLCGSFAVAMPRLGSRIRAALWSAGLARTVVGLCKALGIGIAVFGAVGLAAALTVP
ncbi:hypothetical protein [Streptomyces nodosus]|uniref:hypothetical protein n=1 Tax=Streptomyces nodosus TaxID=40318 RepID=UPI0037FB6375